jgi:mono/diheme cytochrome c family protein
MSAQPPSDPRLDQASLSDEDLMSSHERLLETPPDEAGRYRLLPIGILFTLSGLILFSGTYLNRYAGHYSPLIFNETAKPTTGEAAVAPVDPVVLGQKEFQNICITCHQATGMGMPGVYPPLAGSEWVNGSPERVIRIVLYGLKGEIHVEGHDFSAAAMPVFGQEPGSAYNWSDDKIAAVLTYVRQAFGNKSGPITTEQVDAVKQAVGTRAEMSEADLNAVK